MANVKTINKVVDILMKRDNMSKDEAEQLFNRVRNEIYEVLEDEGGYDDVEDIMYCELGLEMDYIHDILYV